MSNAFSLEDAFTVIPSDHYLGSPSCEMALSKLVVLIEISMVVLYS